MKTLLRTLLFFPSLVLAAAAAEERVCPPPPDVPGAALMSSSAGEARYKCAEGLEPYGGSRVVRCSGGQWGPLTLLCRKKPCGSAGELLNGYFQYEGEASDKAYAICNDGYSVRGPALIECEVGVWPKELPTCEEGTVTCPAPRVENSENRGLAQEYNVNEVVAFRCRPGFQMKGEAQIRCGSGGQWQPPLPQCVPAPDTNRGTTTCSVPKVDNSETKGLAQEYNINEVVAVRCSPGFQMKGKRHIRCGSDGQWQPPLPQCVPVPETNNKCGVPETPEFANAILAPKFSSKKWFASDSSVYYECEMGHVRSQGGKYRKCVQGQWTPLTLRCRRRLCGSAGEILDGHYEYTGVEFGDTATAVCDEGFQLVGQATRNCLKRGWDGHPPVCEAISCDDPPVVDNAEIANFAEAPFEYRTVVAYRCVVGSFMGPSSVWCKEDGTWSTPLPQCKDVTCAPPRILNASWVRSRSGRYQFRDTIVIQCDPRFSISGEPTITCGQDGQWTPQLPKCKAITAWSHSRRG